MNSIPSRIVTFIATSGLAVSQAEQDRIITESFTTATARILGKIPDGTPPPPAPPKPEYHVAASDVLSATSHEQGGRTVTIREIKPIDLPPPPPPAEPALAESDAEFSLRLSEYWEAHPRNELLFLGATVFRSKDSPPRTLVRWWPQGGKGDIKFWSSADFALIAGGVQTFADTAGERHHIFMGWGNVDLDRIGDLYAAKGREYDAPDMPDFPEGKATFQISGERQPNAEELTVIQSLHDIYNHRLDELRTAHAGRERARIEREEFLKANPPQPKDITLNYWRVEKPSAKVEGGAAR
jgi:hypothetical protein